MEKRKAKIGTRIQRKKGLPNYGSYEVCQWLEVDVEYSDREELDRKAQRVRDWVMAQVRQGLEQYDEVGDDRK